MNDFIQRLPTDVILQIIPYTYHLQNIHLLYDIRNYTESKTKLFQLYHKYWIIETQSHDSNEDIYWLLNDIFAYTNSYYASMYGYVDRFYNIFQRNIFLRTKDDIDKYVCNLEKKNISSQINVLLGLLTINERRDIISATFSDTYV